MHHRSDNDRLGPLPIALGVTGHRNIRDEDRPELERLVGRVIDELCQKVPHTPIEIISSLAEGADRLAARVALERGARLVVPLPMPRELYQDDFTSEESHAEFDELLEQASQVITMPIPEHAEEGAIATNGPDRDRQYGVMGAWTVRNSHALLALWDGEISHLPHGTSDVVLFNLEGIPDQFSRSHSRLQPPEGDPVYHIVTPREGDPVPGDALTLRMHYPTLHSAGDDDAAAERRFAEVLTGTERFNRDALAREDEEEGREERQRSVGYLVDEDRPLFDRLGFGPSLALFGTADSLAGSFAVRTRRSLTWVFLTLTVSVILFDVYTHVYLLAWPLLAGYLLGLVVTYGLVVRSSRGQYHSRYLDYRALAEGLRVRLFWEVVGVQDEIADNYLHKQRSELDWVRYALRVWKRSDHGTAPSARGLPIADERDPAGAVGLFERLDLVRRRWVDDQRRYFVRAAEREEAQAHRAVKWGNILIIIGILLALFQVVAQAIDNPDFTKEPSHWLLVAVALAPIFAGLAVGYAEKRAHHDHARQYERMALLYDYADRRLVDLLDRGDLQGATELIEELGKEALAENGDWVLVHRDRPIEVPKG